VRLYRGTACAAGSSTWCGLHRAICRRAWRPFASSWSSS
jgi:hypothetical protein